MPIITGDLLTDPSAQSFISLEDAVAYLWPEQKTAWELAGNTSREAALVQASRWLAATYRFHPLDIAGLTQVGQVAARLAAETIGEGSINLFGSAKPAAKSLKAGSVEIAYADPLPADAAGRTWPWLARMLSGWVYQRGLGIGVLVV